MRDTDRLIVETSDPESTAGWGKVRELKRQGTSGLAALLDSPRLFLGDAPAAHSFVKYDPEQWLPTMRASLSGVGAFVLQPCALITGLTLALTVLAKYSVDADVRETHFAKHAPSWTQLPPFAHTVLGGALSFIMVFRTNTAYSRWWEARLMWGQITIACRSMGAQSAAMMSAEQRPLLFSELIAFALALKNHLRDEKTDPSELASAMALRGDSEPERLEKLATAPSPHNALVAALSATVRAGLRRDDKELTASAYLFFSEELRSMTAAATACERIKSSPMPLGYVSALRFFLVLWLTTLPLTMIGSYGWFSVPVIAFISFLFLNLESVALEIEQPFGHDANDLPLEEYCGGIERVLLALLRQGKGANEASRG